MADAGRAGLAAPGEPGTRRLGRAERTGRGGEPGARGRVSVEREGGGGRPASFCPAVLPGGFSSPPRAGHTAPEPGAWAELCRSAGLTCRLGVFPSGGCFPATSFELLGPIRTTTNSSKLAEHRCVPRGLTAPWEGTQILPGLNPGSGLQGLLITLQS